jgi:hypothetical protein
MELNLYLIIKRQNFRPFFSSIHFFAHLPLITGSREFLLFGLIYCLAQYGVWFQNVLDCVWSMFNQRVHTHAQKKSIPNMITIYSKFIFFLFLFRCLFGLFCFLDYLQSVTYLIRFSFSYPFHFFSWFHLFVFLLLFLVFSFLDYQVRFMPFPLLFCISFLFSRFSHIFGLFS